MLPHLDAVYGFARWLTRDPVAAQDVAQEAMLRALPVSNELAATDHLVGADRAFV